MKKLSGKQLTLKGETIRNLDSVQLRGAAGGMTPLTFGTVCFTANCMTLGTFCPTHDCTLTFTSC